MLKEHGIICDPYLSSKRIAIDGDIRSVFSEQEITNKHNEEQKTKEVLRNSVDRRTVHQALLRLIVYHDLPLSTVEWPELHTLVFALNHQAINCLWKTHRTTAIHVAKTFKERQQQVACMLQGAQSMIHLTTDTWHSPNFKELQAITAHFIDDTGKRQKALIALPELFDGHAGVKVAGHIIETLKAYKIEEKLGYITADNHGANDTMCQALSQALSERLPPIDWQPVQQRLRCIGHMLNIAVQAFFYAKDEAAIKLVIEESLRPGASIDDELLALSQKDTGWLAIAPLKKILSFCSTLRRSDRQYNAFKRMAGKVIRAPNDTRWNSYLNAFEDAVELKGEYTTFTITSELFNDYQLTASEWQLVDLTIQFLQPFRHATKRCEGDYVTLDEVQFTMDAISTHYSEQKILHPSNTSFLTSILTSWYAFDKYYKLIDETGAYTAAILLHPNLRKSYIQSAWHSNWVKPGVDRVKELWLQYKDNNTSDSATEDASNLTQYERYQRKIQAKQRRGKGAQDEYERFITAPAESITTPPLDWWLEPSQRRTYPALSKMAIDVLSAMAMSAESERVFSAARRTIPWTRARLNGRTIEQLECLKHWQKAGLISEDYILASDDDSDTEQHLEEPQEPEIQEHPS
jgi:hypothetical protein